MALVNDLKKQINLKAKQDNSKTYIVFTLVCLIEVLYAYLFIILEKIPSALFFHINKNGNPPIQVIYISINKTKKHVYSAQNLY